MIHMFQGKNKAITFSYDDGVTQDRRLIEIFNRYGLKATFNINSGLLDRPDDSLMIDGKKISHAKVSAAEVQRLYQDHEVAVHTLTHPNLTELDEQEIIRQVEEDRKNLSKLAGYEVIGMAYPCGGVNNDDRVARVLSEHTAMRYARTITSSNSFALQANPLRFNPSVYHMDWADMEKMADEFLAMRADAPQLFYIWGHSYEFDINDTWDRFEAFCQKISGRGDIFYGTNREVLL